MSLDGHGFEIIGLSLFGPHPVDAVHLEIHKGLTVLYGLNGSGKTTILREAESVLRGVGPDRPKGAASPLSCLHVRLTELENDSDAFQLSPFESSLFDSLVTPESDPDGVLEDSTRSERWQQILNETLSSRLLEKWIWDLPVLAQQKSIAFCLVPRGTAERPAWWSYLSVELSETQWESLADYREKYPEIVAGLLVDGYKTAVAYSGLNNPLQDFDRDLWTRRINGNGPGERDYLRQWPKSFPVPVSHLGEIFTSPVHVISDRGTIASIRDHTNQMLVWLAEEHGELIEIADASTTELNPQFSSAVSTLQENANLFLELTGPHFFGLALDLKSPSEWFVGEVPEWTATVEGQAISMGRLSGAELRWALTALQWALTGLDTSRPQVFIIDEPERSLHRMRERELPNMLKNLCGSSENMMVLAASHAPAFLDVRVGESLQLHHVSRLRGYSTVLRPVDLGTSVLTSRTAETLGLAPSDLLQLTRVFVLVEGAHDEIVLTKLIGDDISRGGGRIIPIGGAAHARSIADARILFDATDASIVFVMDNLVAANVKEIWDSATEQYGKGNRKEAKKTLARLTRISTGGEAIWLQALGERAIDANVLPRIRPFPLSKRDILFYLPPNSFVAGDATWERLETDYERARQADVTKDNFKSWLKKNRGADFSRENVELAAQSMDSIPQEFTDLSITVQSQGLFGAPDGFSNR